MPYKSEAQRKYMNAAAERGDVPKKVADEFNKESKGKKDLPERVSKAREEAKASLNKLNEKLDDQFFKGSECKASDEDDENEDEVNKALKASVVNSLAKRERLVNAIAAYDEPGTYGAANAYNQPAVGTNRVATAFEPPVVPIRSIETPFAFQPTGVEVYKSCDTCGHISKSVDSSCSYCDSLRAANKTAPEIWRR